MKFTEATLKLYAAPLSQTEDEKCKHAIEAIRDALKDLGFTDDKKAIALLESETLSYSVAMRSLYSDEKISIFIQGSYANNTCVRNESDVDIAIVRSDTHEYAFGSRFTTSSVHNAEIAKQLKDAVERALRKAFPYQVKRGNKSIKVAGNTYRKQADTVPCIAMNYYYKSESKDYLTHYDGVIIYADDGSITRNFPKQHISNGKAKNVRTKYYYKRMVRIIKKMRHLMSDIGYESADNVSSFGLESLVWNIPDEYFTKYSRYGWIFEDVVKYLYDHRTQLPFYHEANGIKLLCQTPEDVQNYSKFIEHLYAFFEYNYAS